MKHNVSFEFYFNVFCGGREGIITAEKFERYVMSAERLLGSYIATDVPEKFSEDVKLCLCEIAEKLFRKGETGDIRSESVDGYSVTFADKADSQWEIRNVILQRLGKSGLLYAGVE